MAIRVRRGVYLMATIIIHAWPVVVARNPAVRGERIA